MKPHMGEVMAQARLVRTRASALLALKLARLKLGLSRGVALQHVQATLSRFAMMYPDTEIALRDDGAGPLREALRRGDVEVAVLPDRPPDIDDLHYHAIGADCAQLLVRPDHRLAAFAVVRLNELPSETLIACDGCPFFAAIKRRLAEHGQPVRPGITVGASGWLPTLAAAGLGVAVTGLRFGAPPGLVGRAMAELPGSRDVYLATKRGRLYSPPVKAFLDLVLKCKRRPLEAGAA